MFFDADRIQESLICTNCKGFLIEPKTLPCGETICQRCLDHIMSQNLACKFKCCICEDLHSIPINGFQTNKLIARLVNPKSDEIYRSKIVNYLKQSLDNIQKANLELNKSLKDSKAKIRNHCKRVRKEIESSLEKITVILETQRNIILDQVTAIEEDCIRNLVRLDNYKEGLIKFLFEVLKFVGFWRQCLKTLIPNEKEILAALKMARNYESKLRTEKVRVESLTFNRKLLQFHENQNLELYMNLETPIIGSLSFIHDHFPDFRGWNKIELKHKLFNETSYERPMSSMFVEEFYNGNFFVSYIHKKANQFGVSKFKLVIFDSNGNYLRSCKEDTYSDEYKVCKCDDLIVISFRSIIGLSNLKVYNEQLHKIHCIDLLAFIPYPVQALCATGLNVYASFIQDKKTLIYLIDWQMASVNSSVKENNNLTLPIRFNHEISQLECFDKFIYMKHRHINQITVLDKNSGQVLNKFPILGSKFYLDKNGLVISFCAETRKITHYNSNGEVLNQNEFPFFPTNLEFYVNKQNGNILFYDPTECVLYALKKGIQKYVSLVDWYLSFEVLQE